MKMAFFKKDTDKKSSGKRSKIRLIVGLVLAVMVIAFALISIIPIRQHINEADPETQSLLWRGLQDNYIAFAGMLIVALGIAFGIMPARRPLALRIIGCVVWVAGLVITVETGYLVAKTVTRSTRAEVAPEANRVVIVGTALNPNSSAPFELTARLSTAADWWQGHQETDLIVTAGTDYIPVETADGGEVTTVEGTKNELAGRSEDQKKKGTSTPSVMLNKLRNMGVPARWISQEKKSTNTEEVFRNVITMKGIKADTPIIIVTNGCVMNDTVRIAKNAGFTNISRLPAASTFWGYLTNVMWETWLDNDPALIQAEKSET